MTEIISGDYEITIAQNIYNAEVHHLETASGPEYLITVFAGRLIDPDLRARFLDFFNRQSACYGQTPRISFFPKTDTPGAFIYRFSDRHSPYTSALVETIARGLATQISRLEASLDVGEMLANSLTDFERT